MKDSITLKKHENKKSILHSLDPRTKLIMTLITAAVIIVTPTDAESKFLIYFLFLTILIILARIPVNVLLKRLFFLLPLLVFLAISVLLFGEKQNGQDLSPLWNITVKTCLCFLAFALLSLSTDFIELIKGLEKLKVPNTFIQILSFGFRYSFLLYQEAERINRARDSRTSGKMKNSESLKVVSKLVPHLFFRTFARSERVYAAMLARGYEGKLPGFTTLQLKKVDVLFLCFSTFLLTACWIWL